MDSCRRDVLRVIALDQAIRIAGTPGSITEVVSNFHALYALLVAKESVRFSGSVTITDASGHPITHAATSEGPIMTAMTVDQKATITVLPEDDHNDVTPDQLNWTFDDNGAVMSFAIAADTHSAVGTPVGEGIVNFSAADPSAPQLAPFTGSLEVGPGGTSQLVGTVTIA